MMAEIPLFHPAAYYPSTGPANMLVLYAASNIELVCLLCVLI